MHVRIHVKYIYVCVCRNVYVGMCIYIQRGM